VLVHKELLSFPTYALYYQVPKRNMKWGSSRPKCEGAPFCCIDLNILTYRNLTFWRQKQMKGRGNVDYLHLSQAGDSTAERVKTAI
jgi:hypothetical protein